MLSYSAISDEEQKELLRSRPYSETFPASLTSVSDQTRYRMTFKASDTNGFIITHHGPELQTVNGRVRKIEKLLPFITYARKVSLFFKADDFLISHLDRAIKNNGIGAMVRVPSWKDSLPDVVSPHFASKWQTRMVTGSTDVLNTLRAALREELVKDGYVRVHFELNIH